MDPFQTRYFSENLVVPGIEPGTSESVFKFAETSRKGTTKKT
jgi:hypothetical protein